jgi:hypothetical protein
MSRAFNEDIDNIKVHIIHNLKPFVRKSLKRQFKLNITKRLYTYMKERQNLTGRFMDAGQLIEELEMPTSREIEPGKCITVGRFQARISMGKCIDGLAGKPWIVIRFIIQKDF